MGRRENKIGNEGKAGGKSCRKQGGKDGTVKVRRMGPKVRKKGKEMQS